MAADKNKSPQKTSNFWEPLEDGREITHSPRIIANILAWLKSKRAFLTLLHRGYQSGGTVLIDYDRSGLTIDKPVDWPGRKTDIRVLFKDGAKVWNYFSLNLRELPENRLHGNIPSSIYRLQRRAHFRVEASRGTRADFVYRGTSYSMVPIKDISAGGMQLRTPEKLILDSEDTITNISISIPEGNSLFNPKDQGELVICVRQGRIARLDQDEGMCCYGIDFKFNQSEEKMLLRYVRQLELTLLRKGLSR